MLKVDKQISRVLAGLAANRPLMDWMAEQRGNIALSMATDQGVSLHWSQGRVQMIDELIKTIQEAHKAR